MRAEIVTIGDELLIGQTIDTNSAWIAKQLNKIGVSLYQITSVSDTREHILTGLKEASERADLVLMTGGLGPTKDDITKKTLCEYFDTELVMHEDIADRIKQWFDHRGVPFLEVNRQQAALPKNCIPVRNDRGTAQGMWFDHEGTVYVSMPGVPYEMKGIVENHLLDMIKDRFERPHIEHLTLMTQGIGESSLADMVEDWQDSLEEEGISLAYLPSLKGVKVRLTSIGEDEIAIKEKVHRKAEEFKAIAGQYVFAEEDKPLEVVLGELLVDRKMTVSTAESCTGGGVAALITKIPGASAYFMGSVVSYDNEVKKNLLGVTEETLISHGAVSGATVEQMAKGARELMKTDFSVAISGVAGPGGGSEEKPVGTIWFAVAGPNGVVSKKRNFGMDRERNILRSITTALSMLREEIIKV